MASLKTSVRSFGAYHFLPPCAVQITQEFLKGPVQVGDIFQGTAEQVSSPHVRVIEQSWHPLCTKMSEGVLSRTVRVIEESLHPYS